MKSGTAIVDVAADLLPQALTMLPSTYRIVGSEMNPSIGVVRLIVESEELLDHDTQFTCEVCGTGSARMIEMKPSGGILPPIG